MTVAGHCQQAGPLHRRTATKVCPSCGQTFATYELHVTHIVRECKRWLRAERKQKVCARGIVP